MLKKIFLCTSLMLASYALPLASIAATEDGKDNYFTFVDDYAMRIGLVYQLYDFTANKVIISTPITGSRLFAVAFQSFKYIKGHDIEATVCTPDSYSGPPDMCFDVNHTTCPFPQYHYAIVHKLEGKYSLDCRASGH